MSLMTWLDTYNIHLYPINSYYMYLLPQCHHVHVPHCRSLAKLHMAFDLIQLGSFRGEGIDIGAPRDDVEDAPGGILGQRGVTDQPGQLSKG